MHYHIKEDNNIDVNYVILYLAIEPNVTTDLLTTWL